MTLDAVRRVMPPAAAPPPTRAESRRDGGACPPSRTWHVVRAAYRAEFLAFAELVRAGFHAWVPLVVTRALGHAPRVGPMFPGYLLVAVDAGASWGAITRTRGVEQVLMAAQDVPAVLPATWVEALMARGRAGDGAIDPDAKPFAGARVRVVRGWATGFEGVCQAEEEGRVRVLLAMLGRDVPAAFDPAELREA